MLKGKTAVITGAGSGIGRATVEVFAKSGANIWACAHNPDSGLEIDFAQIAGQNGVQIKPFYFDMTDAAQMKEAFLEIRAEKRNIDILVNNAGMSYDALFPMISVEKAHRLFEVNFFSYVCFTQMVSRQMMRQKSGSIVNMASYLGIDGSRGQAMYSASKAAVIAMTKSLAKELAAYGIRVNAVAPGVVDTKMIKSMPAADLQTIMDKCPMHRPAQPEEIANIILMLAGDLSSYITGQVIRADGGI